MTDSQPQSRTVSGTEVAGGVEVPGGDFECCRRPHKTREQWKFKGRETLWGGYEFLVWTRQDGKRFARWVK